MRFLTLFIAAFALCFAVPVSAQTPDSVIEARMTRRVLTCSDIALNATYLLPQYHEAERQDSIEAVLGFLRHRCGYYAGPVEHYALLYAVDTSGRLDTSSKISKSSLLARLLDYRRAFYPDENESEYSYWYHPYYRESFSAPNYFPFLKSYASTLAARADLSPDAAWLVRYYASGGDTSLLHELDGEAYRGTRLQREYRNYRRVEQSTYVLSAFGGLWSPQGNLSLLGPKGFAGFDMGIWGPRFSVAGYFYGVFGRSRTPYDTYFRDTLFTTNHFFNGGLGLRGDYALWKEGAIEATLGLSIGYESISVIDDETPGDDVDDGKHLPTFNLAPGIAVNYYFSQNMFVNFFGRYHVVNFRNESPGTSFSGNAFSVGIGIGGGEALRRRRMGTK